MSEKKEVLEGLPNNTKAALCYLGAWVTGLIFLLLEKKDQTVRFHAMQSLLAFGGLTILTMVPLVGWVLTPLVIILGFVLWVVLVVKAYQGEKVELPLVADFAKKQLKKMK